MQTVLVVDDMQSERALMAKVVQSIGFTAEFAGNGKEALEVARKSKPILILLDVVMPDRDGFATCRALKKDSETANIPVILVTSKGQASDKVWGKRQGASGYVTKPYSESELVAEIQKLVA